jgi:hypothetical protein
VPDKLVREKSNFNLAMTQLVGDLPVPQSKFFAKDDVLDHRHHVFHELHRGSDALKLEEINYPLHELRIFFLWAASRLFPVMA